MTQNNLSVKENPKFRTPRPKPLAESPFFSDKLAPMSLTHSILSGLLFVSYQALELYKTAIIAHVVMSWLIGFNIVNSHSPFVRAVGNFLYRITEPALYRLRRFVPPIGGIDLSPIVLFLVIAFIQYVLRSQAIALGI